MGEYRHTIDTKKRLALPVKFRSKLGKKVVVTIGLDSCLVIYTEKEWEGISDKLGKLPLSQAEARKYARTMMAGAMEVTLDKLGRVLIPDYLKKYAGLGKKVVIFGISNRIEVWDSQKWETYRKSAEKNLETLASKLGDLGI